MIGDGRDSYEIELKAGDVVVVSARQIGADIALSLSSSNGAERVLDSPGERNATEIAVLAAPTPGTYTIAIAPVQAKVASGRYRLRVETLNPTVDADVLHALTAMSEAAALFHENTADSRARSIALYREANNIWRRMGDRAREALTTFYLADALRLADARQDALEAYARARSLWVDFADPEMELAATRGSALTHLDLGEYERLQGELEEILPRLMDLARSGPGFLADAAETRNNLCLADLYRARLTTARSCFEGVLAQAQQSGDGRLIGAVLNNLGGVHYTRGEPNEALRYFQDALNLRGPAGDVVGVAEAHNNLAITYDLTGESDLALEHYRIEQDLLEQVGDLSGQGRTLNNIGAEYLALGDSPRAREYLEAALPLRIAAQDKIGEARTRRNLGDVAFQSGDAHAALEQHRRVVEIWHGKTDAQGEASTRVSVGRDHLALGDVVAASTEVDAAQALAEAAATPALDLAIRALRGEVLLRQGRAAAAAVELQAAFSAATSIGDVAEQLRVGALLADARWAAGEHDAAVALLYALLDTVESMHSRLSSISVRPSFMARAAGLYRALVTYLLTDATEQVNDPHVVNALLVLERGRARTLVQTLVRNAAAQRADIPASLLERRQDLRRAFNAKVEQRVRTMRRGDNTEAARLALEYYRVQEELEQVEAEIEHLASTGLSINAAPVDEAALMQLLDSDTVLLEYMLAEPESHVWRVAEDGIRHYRLAGMKSIDSLARTTYAALKSRPSSPGRLLPIEAEALSSALLAAPLAGDYPARIVIVPDGVLNYIPFATLPLPSAESSPYEPLVGASELVHLPSFGTLIAQRNGRRTGSSAAKLVAVIADPIFSSDDPRFSAADKAARFANGSAAAEARGGYARLPWSRQEAMTLLKIVPKDAALVVTDFDANVSLVQSGALDGYRIVHFATHGVFDTDNPELSRLLLSVNAGEVHGEPGMLTSDQVADLRLNAELVVLSGCETALGAEADGEGLIGLTRSFMYSGAKRVAASLWEVSDRATAELMKRFYTAVIQDAEPVPAALRHAQLEMRAERQWRHPYFWGGFVVQGEWNTPVAGNSPGRR